MHQPASNYRDLTLAAVEPFADVPFFILPLEQQATSRSTLQGVIGNLAMQLNTQTTQSASVTTATNQLLMLLKKDMFNELIFVNTLEQLIGTNYEIIKKLRLRATSFWIANAQLARLAKSMSSQQIIEHDTAILAKDMQLYALDYFLYVLSLLQNADAEAQWQIIMQGKNQLPALKQDALDDDMLKKIVYRLIGLPLRHNLMTAYYAYKNVFLHANAKADDIVLALRNYCLSLLKISQEYSIATLEQGIYLPYPVGTPISKIINDVKGSSKAV